MKKIKEKTNEYFSHDYYARIELQEILMELGHEGKSIYWDLVEMLYENGGYLKLADIKTHAFVLRTSPELIENLIDTKFGLFQKDETVFWSESALKRFKKRLEISAIKSIAGIKGAQAKWEKRQPKPPKEPKLQRKPKRIKDTTYKKIPEIEYVNLTENEYQKLHEKHKDRFLKALIIFDTWLGKKGTTAKQYIGKSHYAHFRADAWVWERADELTRKEQVNNGNAISSEFGCY